MSCERCAELERRLDAMTKRVDEQREIIKAGQGVYAHAKELENRLSSVTKSKGDYPLSTLTAVKEALYCCSEDPDLDHARRVLDAIAGIVVEKLNPFVQEPPRGEIVNPHVRPQAAEPKSKCGHTFFRSNCPNCGGA